MQDLHAVKPIRIYDHVKKVSLRSLFFAIFLHTYDKLYLPQLHNTHIADHLKTNVNHINLNFKMLGAKCVFCV